MAEDSVRLILSKLCSIILLANNYSERLCICGLYRHYTNRIIIIIIIIITETSQLLSDS